MHVSVQPGETVQVQWTWPAGSVWHTYPRQQLSALFDATLSGDKPGKKFDMPGSLLSGVRSPLVSTTTSSSPFAMLLSVRLHGREVAGKVKLPVSSSFRALLLLALRAGFTGM